MGGRGATSGGGGGGFSKTFEDRKSGGQVYTEQGRIDQSKKSNGERQKYEKEAAMCKTLAKNGHTVVHLDDRNRSDGTYDILLDGHKADLKSLKGANNILREASKATKKQGAEKVVFRFDKITAEVKQKIEALKQKGIHGYYYGKGGKELFEF